MVESKESDIYCLMVSKCIVCLVCNDDSRVMIRAVPRVKSFPKHILAEPFLTHLVRRCVLLHLIQGIAKQGCKLH
jgi:hypothetical protein